MCLNILALAMYLTWLDNNSWLIELAGSRILLDPWLVGQLTFGNLDWLFKGSRQQEHAIPSGLDLILLSQGLEDHAHPETLKQLDKSIPVAGSLSAAKVARQLGFTQVTALKHGETLTLNNAVTIQATPGSPLGPIVQENGYLLKELASGTTLYYEPHGFHAPIVKQAAIDIVITPLIDLALPIVGSIIKGSQSALELAQWVKPQVMVPTAANGNVVLEGLLVSLLKETGSVDQFRAQLAQNQLPTQVLEPKPGDRFAVPLRK